MQELSEGRRWKLAAKFRKLYPKILEQAIEEIASDNVQSVNCGKARIEYAAKWYKLVGIENAHNPWNVYGTDSVPPPPEDLKDTID